MLRSLVLLLLLAVPAWTCVCGDRWPTVKQAWRGAPAVFLGTVEIAEPDGDPREVMFQEQFIRIRVDEAFKGVTEGQVIELREPANDCAAKFRRGERGVFYMHGEGVGEWGLRPCSHSFGSPESGGDDLLFLRGLPGSAVGTRLSGRVEYYQESSAEGFKRVAGLANTEVRVSGAGGFSRKVKTNEAGVYEVFGLSPGEYSVSIEVPRGLKLKFPVITGSPYLRGRESNVMIEKDGGAGVSFILGDDTLLTGRMLDAKGAPLKGVCIDLEPVDRRGGYGSRFFDCSKKGGRFQMGMMPEGKYWLVARDKVKFDGAESESTLYYPNVRDREAATMVTVRAGEHLRGLDIRLPSTEKRHKIAGQLSYADGARVSGATITFASAQHGYSETTKTNAEGVFGLSAVKGSEGQLTGQLMVFEPILRSCPELKVESRRRGMTRFIDGVPIRLTADSDQDNLRLILPSPSCKSWPKGRD